MSQKTKKKTKKNTRKKRIIDYVSFKINTKNFLCLCLCLGVWCVQVQNISQSMEVLDLRTYRDLQYVRNTESLMKVVDGKLKVASDNPRSLNPKGFQVIVCLSLLVHVYYCQASVRTYHKKWQCSHLFAMFARCIAISFILHRQYIFFMNLNRLPHKHRCPNSIQKLALSPWIMHRGNLNKFTCSWIIKPLDLEEEWFFSVFRSLHPFFPLSPYSAALPTLYILHSGVCF